MSTVNAQQGCKSVEYNFKSTFTMCNVNRFSSSIYVKGKAAENLVKVLFRGKDLKGFTHRLKKVSVAGIESLLNLEVIQGIHGYEKSKGTSYFNIYNNETDKKRRLENIKET
jgi:hypothetical protein